MDQTEAVQCVEAYYERVNDQKDVLALFSSYVINKDRKRSKQVKPEQLWERPKKKRKKQATEEELEQIRNEDRLAIRRLSGGVPKPTIKPKRQHRKGG